MLRDKVEVEPSVVFNESIALYAELTVSTAQVGVFDERDYLLAELSFLAAKSGRHLGKPEDAEKWLDRAEALFRLTINPAPHLAGTAYLRLALRYDKRNFDEVLEQAPVLARTFDRLDMPFEAAKTRFLEAVTLKVLGRRLEAFRVASSVASNSRDIQPALMGQVWSEIGEYHASCRDFAPAADAFAKAISLLQNANRPIALMSLKLSLGELFRVQERSQEAYEAFRSANEDARKLEMPVYVAYSHVLAGEALLALERPREAEWEILAALPLLDAHKMVPEALAAVAVLRESINARKLDSGALTAVRQHLQAQG